MRVVAAGILVCLMVPLAAGLVSLLLFSARLGLLDSPLALWGPYIAFHLPFSIYLMKTYYEGIPVSLLEAATVDGANFFQIYLRVVLPMGVPMMVALAAINFVKIWGEFALELALLPNPKWWTLSAGIFNRAEMMRHYSMPEMLAAALLAVVPSLVMFALCQKGTVFNQAVGRSEGLNQRLSAFSCRPLGPPRTSLTKQAVCINSL